MPSEYVLVTELTTGAPPSTTKVLFADSDPLEPGGINVNVALFPDMSLMEPPFNERAVVFE